MATGRENVDEREAFNQWFHSTGLVLVVTPCLKSVDICHGVIENGRLARVAFLEDGIANAPDSVNAHTGKRTSTADDEKALAEEWRKTGEHPGLDTAMDAEGNFYDRINGEWVMFPAIKESDPPSQPDS